LATVITSLASAIPVVGDSIVTWLWGGFSVDNATLNRFFSLHYLLPFVIAGASLLHLAALHQYGSNNPLGINSSVDKISFYPYFYVKDLVGWVTFAIFFSIFVFYAPNVLGHPDNYIPANPMSTPAHIVPEWYFCAPRSYKYPLGYASSYVIFTCTPIHMNYKASRLYEIGNDLVQSGEKSSVSGVGLRKNRLRATLCKARITNLTQFLPIPPYICIPHLLTDVTDYEDLPENKGRL
jgi:Cytochrome b/b6/petB/Cytochrome b(C-terminal)/b6/petD